MISKPPGLLASIVHPPDTQFEAIYQILGTSMDKMIHHLGKHALWKNSQLHIGKIETHQIA
jgi:hypothetical protein